MRAIFVIGFLLTLVLAFTACDDGGTTPTAGNTPAHVLRSLIYAFNNRDAEMLDRALSDDFTFHFDPYDVGSDIGGYTIPDSWGRDEHLTASGNMFEQAYSIDFNVGYETIGNPDKGADEFDASKVQILLLVMVDPVNGFLGQGPCNFKLVNESLDSTDTWVITDWWDYTAHHGTLGLTEESSLGSILVMYR
jgi:hypothetical protein